jgi:hypothetical protein
MGSNEELAAAVRTAVVDREGRMVLPCSKAFQLAEDHSVEVGVIGAICNQNDIKIVQCQLGCFK